MIALSNTYQTTISTHHKIFNIKYSEDEKFFFVSLCCSIVQKWEVKTMKIVAQYDGNEFSSFSNFVLIPSQNQVLFVNPCKIVKLDANLNQLKELKVNLRKGIFLNNFNLSADESIFGIQLSNKILFFDTLKMTRIFTYEFSDDISHQVKFSILQHTIVICFEDETVTFEFAQQENQYVFYQISLENQTINKLQDKLIRGSNDITSTILLEESKPQGELSLFKDVTNMKGVSSELLKTPFKISSKIVEQQSLLRCYLDQLSQLGNVSHVELSQDQHYLIVGSKGKTFFIDLSSKNKDFEVFGEVVKSESITESIIWKDTEGKFFLTYPTFGLTKELTVPSQMKTDFNDFILTKNGQIIFFNSYKEDLQLTSMVIPQKNYIKFLNDEKTTINNKYDFFDHLALIKELTPQLVLQLYQQQQISKKEYIRCIGILKKHFYVNFHKLTKLQLN